MYTSSNSCAAVNYEYKWVSPSTYRVVFSARSIFVHNICHVLLFFFPRDTTQQRFYVTLQSAAHVIQAALTEPRLKCTYHKSRTPWRALLSSLWWAVIYYARKIGFKKKKKKINNTHIRLTFLHSYSRVNIRDFWKTREAKRYRRHRAYTNYICTRFDEWLYYILKANEYRFFSLKRKISTLWKISRNIWSAFIFENLFIIIYYV